MTSTVAIVRPTTLDVDTYAAAGREVEVSRADCPACGRPMIFWSGYPRDVRAGVVRRIWIRRLKCTSCRITHAVVPVFCLLRRLDAVEVIGAGLEEGGAGRGKRAVAEILDVPHTTVRDWWRRFAERAAVVAAAAGAIAVSLGDPAPALSGDPPRAALDALTAAHDAARRRLGPAVGPRWRYAALISGGELLATTTHPPWSAAGGRRLMAPVP